MLHIKLDSPQAVRLENFEAKSKVLHHREEPGLRTSRTEMRKRSCARRDSNPQPFCHEPCALPLCYHHCPTCITWTFCDGWQKLQLVAADWSLKIVASGPVCKTLQSLQKKFNPFNQFFCYFGFNSQVCFSISEVKYLSSLQHPVENPLSQLALND